MELSIRIMFGIEHIAQYLPERVRFGLSFCIGFLAYILDCDMFLDFWDLAIVTSPSGVPATISVSRADIVILAGIGHISTTLFNLFGSHLLEVIKFFV